MQQKRFWPAGLLVVPLCGCGALLVMLRGGLQPPTLTFQTTKITAASEEGTTIAAVFQVENPNPIAMKFGGASAAYFMDAKKLFNVDVPGGMELPASTTSVLEVPIHIAFSAIPDLETLEAARDEVDYSIESTVTLRSAAGDEGLPLKWVGTLPLPKVPRLSFSGIQVDQLSFGSARLTLIIKVDNPNVYPETFEALTGRLMSGDDVLATVTSSASQPVGAQGTTEVRVPIEVATAGTTVSEALQSRSSAFRLQGTVRMNGKELPVDGTAGLK